MHAILENRLIIRYDSTLQDFAIQVSGELDVDNLASPGEFFAETPGQISALENTIDNIVTPVVGWQSANNIYPGVVGRNIAGLIRALASEANIIETELVKLLLERSLQTAVGQQLDGIGTILVLPRNARDDDSYRQYLMAKIYFNSQSGEPETLIVALKAITEATRIQYWENYPASCQLFTDGELIFTGLPAFIESMGAGGVGKIPITASKGEVPTFLLDTVPESDEPGKGGIA